MVPGEALARDRTRQAGYPLYPDLLAAGYERGHIIARAWSTTHPGWITMDLSGFTFGQNQFVCHFSDGVYGPYSLSLPAGSVFYDNGKTCMDQQAGDHVWVTVGGVESNQLTVATPPPASTPPPSQAPTRSYAVDDAILGGSCLQNSATGGTWYRQYNCDGTWVADGIQVAVSCAQSGPGYVVNNYGTYQTWVWFGRTASGQWVRAAAIWNADGDDGNPHC